MRFPSITSSLKKSGACATDPARKTASAEAPGGLVISGTGKRTGQKNATILQHHRRPDLHAGHEKQERES